MLTLPGRIPSSQYVNALSRVPIRLVHYRIDPSRSRDWNGKAKFLEDVRNTPRLGRKMQKIIYKFTRTHVTEHQLRHPCESRDPANKKRAQRLPIDRGSQSVTLCFAPVHVVHHVHSIQHSSRNLPCNTLAYKVTWMNEARPN